ncbi:MAG: aldolase, partial [Chloroflexi bacterium]|nr:aldolase [Chloroflexota bacterium]
QTLMQEAIAAGFFNIDVDTSTLVDLSQSTIPAQQKLNVGLSAKLSSYIRSIEPAGVTISVGGEIGEVGGHNSTEEELRAYLGGFKQELAELKPGAVGLSKISIQTGTSHGGVVLPDGSIAKVNVDFNTMRVLSDLSQKEYGLGGAVQHVASTLPESAFDKFPESHALEIHLATNFMNIFYDKIPAALRQEIYAYLDANHSSERKPDMTDEQFYYKTRKYGVGQFKKQSWQLPEASKAEVVKAWEEQFDKLFHLLGLKDSRRYVEQTVKPVKVAPDLSFYLGATAEAEEVSDLAD